jgi:hypothetical protein
MVANQRQGVVVRDHPTLSISRKSDLLALNRSSLY